MAQTFEQFQASADDSASGRADGEACRANRRCEATGGARSLITRRFVALALVTALAGGTALAGDLPDLRHTTLYQTVAHDCHPVDLTTWHHPTKQVLSQAQVPLDALELCNAGKYPIFYVAFTYDPMTLTDAFFVPFYNAMFSANGHNPLAFVDRASNEIVYVSPLLGEPKVNGRILIDVSYEVIE